MFIVMEAEQYGHIPYVLCLLKFPKNVLQGGTFAAFVAYKFFAPLPQSWIRVDVMLNCKTSILVCDLM